MKDYLKQTFHKDFLASLVVFLVALPLCMGIAMASGVPVIYGLISGIIGGLVIGSFTGSPLQVSGPAAGLAVVVYDIVQTEGLAALGMITLMAGLFQVAFAALRAGPLFRAISPSVVKGMLAGIGVLIFASQFHVMVDDSPKASPAQNLWTIPQAILKIFDTSQGMNHTYAGVIGIFTIALIVGWNVFKKKVKNPVPGPLVGIIAASLAVILTGVDIKLVELPTNLAGALSENLAWNNLGLFKPSYVLSALMMAFIATTETLLCVTAVDQLKTGHKSNYNKELMAQGAGNSLAGLVGALPLTGVIVRTSANVESGGETKASTIMHGAWLAIMLFMFPFVLGYIPKAGLAAILVFTGYKLVDIKAIKTFNRYGKSETFIYLSTIAGVVFINLLAGVALGFALSLVRLLWKTHVGRVEKVDRLKSANETIFVFKGFFSFINLPRVASLLERRGEAKKVILDFRSAWYTDHAIDELVESFQKSAQRQDIQVEILKRDAGPSQDIPIQGKQLSKAS